VGISIGLVPAFRHELSRSRYRKARDLLADEIFRAFHRAFQALPIARRQRIIEFLSRPQ